MTWLRGHAHDQDGFTLVELIVAIVLMGIVAVPLGVSFVEAVKTTGATSTSLGSSHDTQLVDYYLQRDAAGASATSSPSAWACAVGAGATVGPNAGIIQFTWPQADVATGSTLASGYAGFSPGTNYEADYIYQSGGLTRYYCSVTASGTFISTIQTNRVASTLSLTVPPVATPVSTCTGGAGPCITVTSVTWTDSSGKVFSTTLYDRSFGS